ncbi:hypothetical protein DV736_g4062, partial [Chaetothyriales sp. CBS 134916]
MESSTHASFKIPEAPGTPLRQLSSEQMNQKCSSVNIPQLPSLHSNDPDDLLNYSPRHRESVSSAVQEKVAFLNSLSSTGAGSLARSSLRRDAMPVSPSKRDALERAICGYEESQKLIASANAEIEQLRSTVKNQAKQLAVSGARIDKLMEQLANEKQQNEEMRTKYVQEVKKVRKQCFQAEKVQLELQEEVKETKKELRKRDAELAHAKQRREEAKQEAFERAWAGRIEKEASSASRRAHEMVRIASQSEELGEDEATAVAISKPQTVREPEHHCYQAVSTVARPFFSDFVEYKAGERELFGESFTLEDHIAELYREVAYYRRELGEARETINLMCMECQLQICECRRAEKQGKRFIYDVDYEVKMQEERTVKKRRLEEDDKAQRLPPVPTADQSMHPDHHAALEDARQVPLPEQEQQESGSRESTPTTTAALEEMTQVLVAPTHNHADLNFTFSISGSSDAHNHPAVRLLPRPESALATSNTDMFDMSPPKNHPPRPSTVLGVRSSNVASPIRLVPESPRATTDKGSMIDSTTTHVALREAAARRSTHRRAHSRPNMGTEFRAQSPLATVTNTGHGKGNRSTTPGSPANSTMFPITPKTKGSMHARSQTHDAVPALHTVDEWSQHYGAGKRQAGDGGGDVKRGVDREYDEPFEKLGIPAPIPTISQNRRLVNVLSMSLATLAAAFVP